MNKIKLNKILSLILIAAMIMTLAVGCGKKNDASSAGAETKAFTFVVTDKEGTETSFDLSTEKKTVGEALLDAQLIEGTESEYGLYVTKVNGIEAIYENDGTYWAFYINGEYAMSGVDTTDVEDGAEYAFKVEGN